MASLSWTDTSKDFQPGLHVRQEDESEPWEHDGSDADEYEEPIIYSLPVQQTSLANNLFFYTNILWYMAFCSFVASIRFGIDVNSAEFKATRDMCVEGAYYEV